MITVHSLIGRTRRGLPYDPDAPVAKELRKLGYVELRALADSEGTSRSQRAHIRYLAALLPHLPRRQLADALHAVLDNPNLTVGDLRLIVDGRSLADPTKSTAEVPIEGIQSAGRILTQGGTYAAAASGSGLSVDTVVAIDKFLGLTQSYDDRIMDAAVAALREGVSVRAFAEEVGLSKSEAHRRLQAAKAVLIEIGEMVA